MLASSHEDISTSLWNTIQVESFSYTSQAHSARNSQISTSNNTSAKSFWQYNTSTRKKCSIVISNLRIFLWMWLDIWELVTLGWANVILRRMTLQLRFVGPSSTWLLKYWRIITIIFLLTFTQSEQYYTNCWQEYHLTTTNVKISKITEILTNLDWSW